VTEISSPEAYQGPASNYLRSAYDSVHEALGQDAACLGHWIGRAR
jgi:hypothetical protein